MQGVKDRYFLVVKPDFFEKDSNDCSSPVAGYCGGWKGNVADDTISFISVS
jgi:hypothetical protein